MRAIIPAAGKGTRLHSGQGDLPKVLHSANGRPLLSYVLDAVNFIDREDIYIVVGYKKEQVTERFGDAYHYVEQTQQLGTGHAVMMCADAFQDYDGTVLVTFGDMPLFRREDMRAMCLQHEAHGAACTLMSAENETVRESWAHIIRDGEGTFVGIVEGRDCTPEQAEQKELFAGVIVFDSKKLFGLLPLLGQNNAQHEYYLTEIPEMMVRRGMKVETYMNPNSSDLFGVNTAEDLERTEKELARRIAK